jgi:uncharacterized protein (TIGR02001 family)
MQISKLLAAVLGTLIALPALADEGKSPFSANVSLVSNYLYRGISQTGAKPALQGGFDYEHESGFYIGLWGSNVSIWSDAAAGTTNVANSSLELDTYAGFRNHINEDAGYDIGFLRYNYPGTYAPGVISPDTNEIYGAIGYKWITAKYSRSLGDTFGLANAGGSSYIDVSGKYAIEGTGLTVGAHYGKQTFNGTDAAAWKAAGKDPSYSDYNISASFDASGYIFGLMYSKTNAKTGGFYTDPQGHDLGKGTVVLSLSRAL